MTWRRILVPLAGVLLTVGCSGTATGIPEDGPLGKAADPGRVCTPVDGTGRITNGILFLRNSSPDIVTLQKASLIKPNGLLLDSGMVAPIVNNTLIGLQPGSVPAAGAQRVTGAQLAGGQELNLVLRLRLSSVAARGTADGVQVEYSSGGHTYRWRSPIAVDLGPPGTPCPTT